MRTYWVDWNCGDNTAINIIETDSIQVEEEDFYTAERGFTKKVFWAREEPFGETSRRYWRHLGNNFRG